MSNLKEMRIKLQILALRLEARELSTKSSIKDVEEGYLLELENLVRDIRNAKGWK